MVLISVLMSLFLYSTLHSDFIKSKSACASDIISGISEIWTGTTCSPFTVFNHCSTNFDARALIAEMKGIKCVLIIHKNNTSILIVILLQK